MQGGWRGRGSRARVTEPDDTYSAAVVEEALLAAAAVSERVFEMAPGISTGTEAAFRDLAEAVFRWTEGLDLQQELADEGARAGAVADLADPTYAASYAVTVHQVLTAARAVQEATALEPDSLPASAVPLLDRLGSAVGEWERQPDAAARWWEEGGRPALIHPVGAPPPTPDPPFTTPPSARRSSGSPPWDLFHPAAAGPRDDPGSAARADRPVASRPRPDGAPLWEPDRPHGVRAAKPLTDDERRRRDHLNREGAERLVQERERQRGASTSQ
jgi:hypothetical protein